MLTALGIICEYNPFHNGHEYHIKKSREITGAEVVVAIMSGDFTERGEIAITDKYTRAKAALSGGADLVIELPVIFSVCGAESFAAGSIALLDSLGVNYLSFGSESSDTDLLYKKANVYANEPAAYKELIKNNLEKGYSYAYSRDAACQEYIHNNDSSAAFEYNKTSSNDILAIEYLKQLIIRKSSIKPFAVKREGSAYLDMELPKEAQNYASASSIRHSLASGDDNAAISSFMPDYSYALLNKINTIDKSKLNTLYKIFASKVLLSTYDELEQIYAAGEGLTNRIKNEIRYCSDFDSLTERVLSKRYSESRLKRLYTQIILGITKADFNHLSKAFYEGSVYARILGFNEKGAAFIKQTKHSENDAKLITNINKTEHSLDAAARSILEYDIKAHDLFNLVCGLDLYRESDLVKMPEILK